MKSCVKEAGAEPVQHPEGVTQGGFSMETLLNDAAFPTVLTCAWSIVGARQGQGKQQRSEILKLKQLQSVARSVSLGKP